MQKTILFFGLMVLVLTDGSLSAWAKPCRERISVVTGALLGEAPDTLYVNGIRVTGEEDYSLELVMSNLELTQDLISARAAQTGLLIGEGFSPLLGHLIDQGATQVRAVDPCYGITSFPKNRDAERLSAFIDLYRNFLIPKNVLEMQIPEGSQDYVWSHLMVNNLPNPLPRIVTQQMLRVLKPGGELKSFGYTEGARELVNELEDAGLSVRTSTKSVFVRPGTPATELLLLTAIRR